MKTKNNKIVVAGLDGANWELIMPWIKEGVLPNLAYLLAQSSWGISKSELPPVTCPSWRCYSTGKNPGKLGVFWWMYIDKEKHTLEHVNSKSFRSLDYFDYLSDTNIKVGVFNMPMTYPPKKLSGFMVSGPPDGQEENFTEPKELAVELKSKGYLIRPKSTLLDQRKSKYETKDTIALIKKKLELALELEKRVDFFHFSIFYINVLQHFFYNGEPTKTAWKLIDNTLGELIKRKRNIIIMSDHGIAPISSVFYGNRWLLENGYLALKGDIKRNIKPRFWTKNNLAPIAKKLGIAALAKKITPARLLNLLPSVPITSVPIGSIDWEKSWAIATGQGGIYLTKKSSQKDYEIIRGELIKELKKLKNPITGNAVAKEVLRGEEAFHGPFLENAPDIIFDQADEIYSVGTLDTNDIFKPPKRWEAENVREGVFLAYGAEINAQKLAPISILDIAPTIMHWLNMSVPRDMDGRILKEIFKCESDSFKREPSYQKSKTMDERCHKMNKEEEEQIEQVLKELGYLE